MRITTEGALWGSIVDHGFLNETVIVSDAAGRVQRRPASSLCWGHGERLIYKPDTFTELQRAAVARIRARVWWLYAALKAYRLQPTAKRKAQLARRFDAIFTTRTGFASLDRLLGRLHGPRVELLAVLERPDIPLHTCAQRTPSVNSSENDIRCQVTRRKVSAGTRSETGRACRDAFLGLMKTSRKLGVSFWNFVGDRLHVPDAHSVSPLPNLIRARAAPT